MTSSEWKKRKPRRSTLMKAPIFHQLMRQGCSVRRALEMLRLGRGTYSAHYNLFMPEWLLRELAERWKSQLPPYPETSNREEATENIDNTFTIIPPNQLPQTRQEWQATAKHLAQLALTSPKKKSRR